MSPLRAQYVGLLTLRGYAQRTQESYVNAVAALGRHYGCSPDRLSDEQIRDYLLGLHRRGLCRGTINVAISALRVFYGVMLKRPVARIEECLPRPRKVTRRARVYGREELRRLFVTGRSGTTACWAIAGGRNASREHAHCCQPARRW